MNNVFNIEMRDLLNAEQVCERVGVTNATLRAWYKFREENPESELARLLPEMLRIGPRLARYWRKSDVKKLTEFKARVPKGCRGVMGSVTQKYVKKTTKQEND